MSLSIYKPGSAHP